MIFLTTSTPIIKAGNKAIPMNYEGEIGGWIPLDFATEYLMLQEKYPLAMSRILVLENSNKEISNQFDELQNEYEKLRKRQAVYIGVAVGSCMFSLAVIGGVIAGLVVAYNTN